MPLDDNHKEDAMDRIIKFRGKRIDNGKWEYGSLYMPPDGGHADICNKTGDHPVRPETVSQLVEISKDGTECYEGDILWDAWNECYWVLKGDDVSHEFRRSEFRPDNGGCDEHSEGLDEDIVGNIWDNPIEEFFSDKDDDPE